MAQSDESTAKDILVTKMDSKRDGFKVFGWHPHWQGATYENYNFQLLDYFSWFSYEIDPATGSYSNPEVIQTLRNTLPEIKQFAPNNNCQFLLTITCQGLRKTNTFLEDRNEQHALLIDSALMLVEELGLNGIDLNFEQVSKKNGRAMSDFIKKISDRLKELNPNHTLVLSLPSVHNGQIDRVEALNDYVDVFTLLSYDFHSAKSTRDGPIAPLEAKENEPSIKTVVSNYLAEGVDPKKILLGLPLYGGSWISGSSELRFEDQNFKQHVTYRNIMSTYANTASIQYDPLSSSAYLVKELENNQYEKIWFEDSLTLTKKWSWAKEKGLGGTAIWALGYDHGRTEIWNAIDKFNAGQDEKNDGLIGDLPDELTDGDLDIVGLLKSNKWPLLVVLGVLLLFGLLRKRKKKA